MQRPGLAAPLSKKTSFTGNLLFLPDSPPSTAKSGVREPYRGESPSRTYTHTHREERFTDRKHGDLAGDVKLHGDKHTASKTKPHPQLRDPIDCIREPQTSLNWTLDPQNRPTTNTNQETIRDSPRAPNSKITTRARTRGVEPAWIHRLFFSLLSDVPEGTSLLLSIRRGTVRRREAPLLCLPPLCGPTQTTNG
jgi:hypothetical protein